MHLEGKMVFVDWMDNLFEYETVFLKISFWTKYGDWDNPFIAVILKSEQDMHLMSFSECLALCRCCSLYVHLTAFASDLCFIESVMEISQVHPSKIVILIFKWKLPRCLFRHVKGCKHLCLFTKGHSEVLHLVLLEHIDHQCRFNTVTSITGLVWMRYNQLSLEKKC